ncbi:lytic transglycosylase domain-containing protein [Magnetovibrio sp. PR-2]|uniref:lytic transglycosylase domain-containing protein n=1 Tax=Magnetovibrio sp. PR-2 TaxID=3120356 RepID=UPI002FCDF483
MNGHPVHVSTLLKSAARRLIPAYFAAVVLLALFVASPATAKELSTSDIKNATAVFKAIDKNRFKDALKLTRRIKSQDLVRVLVWKYLTARNTPADYNDIKPFLKKHPGWPYRKAMLKRAEETMPSKLKPSQILAWFDEYGGPVSTMGRVRKAQADFTMGRKKAANLEFRKIWIEGNFTKRQEKNYYRKHKKLITKKDQIARLERLIWEERYWPARRQLWKVGKKMRKLAIARIWLMRQEGNVDKAISELKKAAPELIDHPGLIYERMRWRRRKGRTEKAAELLPKANGDPMRPDKWWKERAIMARTFLQKDKFKRAYAITSDHGLSPKDAAEYSDAEWISGWIALRFLNQPSKAYKHFQNMLGAVSYPVSVARGSYWSGRASEALGQKSEAKRWLGQAAGYPTTYYGQLARAKLGRSVTAEIPLPQPTAAEKKAFRAHVLTSVVDLLGEMGGEERMKPFLLALSNYHDTPGWKRLAADFAHKSGRPDVAIRIAKNSEQAGMALGKLGYPMLTPPTPKKGKKPETPLVLAVIRQESQFFTKAKSHAGARGLMQVMPATAKKVAKTNRLPYSRAKLQKDANYNMMIGQMYLSDMVEQFDSYPMALAAYNAGPHRVKRWVRNFGDPRKTDTDVIDWVEMIPYKETRNYVQRVLENLGVYRAQLGAKRVAER